MGLELRSPNPDEIQVLGRRLVDLVDDELGGDRWALFIRSTKVGHHAYAAAALRHVTCLLVDLLELASRRRELAVRVLGRAHLEAWIVALCIVYFGDDALGSLDAGYRSAIATQHLALADADRRLQRERKRIRQKNLAIRKSNAHKQRWNESHPGLPPKQLIREHPLPRRDPMNLNLRLAFVPAEEVLDEAAQSWTVKEMADRLTAYGKEVEGPDASIDVVYDLAYRGLSTLGAHPTLWVIDQYLRGRGDRFFVRTADSFEAPDMAPGIIDTAVFATASLGAEVFSLRGAPPPRLLELIGRWEIIDTPEDAGDSAAQHGS